MATIVLGLFLGDPPALGLTAHHRPSAASTACWPAMVSPDPKLSRQKRVTGVMHIIRFANSSLGRQCPLCSGRVRWA
jgi:hypothetical protein